MKATSRGCRRAFTGIAAAPSVQHAYSTSMYAALFFATRATRAPGCTPRCTRPAARRWTLSRELSVAELDAVAFDDGDGTRDATRGTKQCVREIHTGLQQMAGEPQS
jgi:hypothetical protein